MFFLIPALITFGCFYIIGDWFFEKRLFRWLYIIIGFCATWISAGLLIWHRVGLGRYMETSDTLGNDIDWFDGSWSDWISWIATTIGYSFFGSLILFFVIFWPFSRKKWWQFWKN